MLSVACVIQELPSPDCFLPARCETQGAVKGPFHSVHYRNTVGVMKKTKKITQVFELKGLKRRGLCPEEKLSRQAPLEPSKHRDWKQRKVEARTRINQLFFFFLKRNDNQGFSKANREMKSDHETFFILCGFIDETHIRLIEETDRGSRLLFEAPSP